MWQVVWSEVDSTNIVLGRFRSRKAADAFALPFQISDGQGGSSLMGIEVIPEVIETPPVMLPKWRMSFHRFQGNEREGYEGTFRCYPDCPLDEEQFSEHSRDGDVSRYASVYAATKQEAIARFEDHFKMKTPNYDPA